MPNIRALNKRERRREEDRKENLVSNVFSYLIEARRDFYKEIRWLQSLRFKLLYIYLLMFSGIFYVFNYLYKRPYGHDPCCHYWFGVIAIIVLYAISVLFVIKTIRYTSIISSDIKNINVIHNYINNYIEDNASEKIIKFNKVDDSFSNYLCLKGRPATIFIFPIISIGSVFLFSLFLLTIYLKKDPNLGHYIVPVMITAIFYLFFHFFALRRPVVVAACKQGRF